MDCRGMVVFIYRLLSFFLLFTGIFANHLSSQGANVVNGRRILPRNPSTFTRSRGSSSTLRALRNRFPVITSRELRTVLQARKIRENLRRAQAAKTRQTQAQVNTQSSNSQTQQNNGLHFSAQQIAFLSTLFGNDGRISANQASQGAGFVDPRVAFGGHQPNGPPLQIKNPKTANPFVIEAKGAIKVSEIKGPNGQTQVIIDATSNQAAPMAPLVTLKPGEDPPEPEIPKFPGVFGGLI